MGVYASVEDKRQVGTQKSKRSRVASIIEQDSGRWVDTDNGRVSSGGRQARDRDVPWEI